jgi:hypothetical protein
MPNGLNKQLIQEYLLSGKLCFVDQDAHLELEEPPNLPTGLFPDLVEDAAWDELIEDATRIASPGAARDSEFERLVGRSLGVAKSVDLIDGYFAGKVLSSALTDKGSGAYWMKKIMQSKVSMVKVLTRFPTDFVLGDERSRASGALSLPESHRASVLADYVQRLQNEHEYSGRFDLFLFKSTPHDRYLRIGLSKGSMYLQLPKGIDVFGADPLSSPHKLSQLESEEWGTVLRSNEWVPNERESSIIGSREFHKIETRSSKFGEVNIHSHRRTSV